MKTKQTAGGDWTVRSAIVLMVAVVAAVAWLATPATAHPPYVPQGPPFAFPLPGAVLPSITQVPGKEFSTHIPVAAGGGFGFGDQDHGHLLDPEKVLNWDGVGGTFNGIDYTLTRLDDQVDREVDALASRQDALFHEVIGNVSHLLFSVDDNPNVYYEKRGAGPPSGGVWADQDISTLDGAPGSDIDDDSVLTPILDLDGLEVWGPEPGVELREGNPPFIGDADRYSLESTGPLGIPDPLGISVWDSTGVPVWTQAEIASIVSLASGVPLNGFHPEEINLDAMMNFSNPNAPDGATEEIMFSIDPTGPFDGGEIFMGSKSAAAGVLGGSFLFHGGHFWDTPFPVAATYGLESENINALEAVSTVPEPASLLLAGLTILGLAGLRRCGRTC